MHKIVFCISPARCGSTALLRWFEKLDFSIFHEPSIKPYNNVYHDFTKDWYKPNIGFDSFREITKAILKESETRNVFIKDMIFSTYYWFMIHQQNNPDEDFNILIKKSIFIFLIRNPHDSLKAFNLKVNEWNDVMDRCSNYQELDMLYNHLKSLSDKVFVVISEELYGSKENTITILNRLCNLIDIKFDPNSMSWDPKSDDFTGDEWREAKYPELFKLWHGDAIKSNGFGIIPKRQEDDDMKNYDQNQSWQKQLIKAIPVYEFFLSQKK